MAPVAQTLYSVTLLLALIALKLWTGRRHRVPFAFRTGAQKYVAGPKN